MERTLRITGKGKITVTPDTLKIEFDVQAHEWEYETSIKNLNQKVEELRTILGNQGVERSNLKTKNFGIHRDQVYNNRSNKYNFNGFVATHKLEVHLPLDRQLINTILLQIAGKLKDVDFRIAFGSRYQKKYKDELIRDAIRKAKDLAVLITRESEVELKEILSIDHSFNELYLFEEPIDYSLHEQCSDMAAATPDFEPDDFDLTENIHITWRIE